MVHSYSPDGGVPSTPDEWSKTTGKSMGRDADGWTMVFKCYRNGMLGEIMVYWERGSESMDIRLDERSVEEHQTGGGLGVREFFDIPEEDRPGDPETVIDIEVPVVDVQSELEDVAASWIAAMENKE